MRCASAVVWIAGALGLLIASAEACSVPVFRYALERFDASCYRAVIFHRGPLSPEQQKLADALSDLADGKANLEVALVDLAAGADAKPELGWKPAPDTPLPWLVLAYPGAPLTMPAWSGPLTADSLRGLCDSPARREIVTRLLKGDSAVFVLLESGKTEDDAAAAKLLDATLADMGKTLHLPEQDADAPAQFVAELPLRIGFTSLRLSRTDPAEKLFVQLVLHTSKDLQNEAGPIVLPVFGRGRALIALTGKELSADNLQEAGEFLCGACMCTYKEQMPGIDLLLAADWSALGKAPTFREVPPALQGLAPLAQAAAASQAGPSAAPVPSTNVASASVADPAAQGGRLFHRVLLLVLAGVVLFVVVVGVVLRLRAGEKRG